MPRMDEIGTGDVIGTAENATAGKSWQHPCKGVYGSILRTEAAYAPRRPGRGGKFFSTMALA